MRTYRGILITLVFFILILFPTSKGARARAGNDLDISDQITQVRPAFPGNIGDVGNPDDKVPPEEPESKLDANDYLSALFTGELTLNINGLEREPILHNSVLRFRVTPVEEASAATINFVGVRTTQAGRYEIFFSDFDQAQFNAKLLVENMKGKREYELRPGSQVSFTANRLDALIFDGEDKPAPGVKIREQIEIDDSKVTYVMEHTGDLVVEARQHPNFMNPLPEVPTNPNPQPDPGTPSVAGPVGGDTGGEAAVGPDGVPIFDDMGGQLGGSGCSLQSVPAATHLGCLLPLLGFLTWGFVLRSKKSR